jgi:hypothetical protein
VPAACATSSIGSSAPCALWPHSVTSLPAPVCGSGVRSTVIMSIDTRPNVHVRTPSTNTGVPLAAWRG